jgi:hypothetical protein
VAVLAVAIDASPILTLYGKQLSLPTAMTPTYLKLLQRDLWCISHYSYRYEDAEEACRNAVEIWDEKSGPTASVTSSSLELLAKIMRGTARYGTLVPSPSVLHVLHFCFIFSSLYVTCHILPMATVYTLCQIKNMAEMKSQVQIAPFSALT